MALKHLLVLAIFAAQFMLPAAFGQPVYDLAWGEDKILERERNLDAKTLGQLQGDPGRVMANPGGTGFRRDYRNGSIYVKAGADHAYVVLGAIQERWNQLGAEQAFGYPISDELTPNDGRGRFSEFEHLIVYWEPSLATIPGDAVSATRLVFGDILGKYRVYGGVNGELGAPLTDELRCPDGVGRYNQFELGAIYWTSSLSAHTVLGAVNDKWAELDWERGLGYPTTDTTRREDSSLSCDFERGRVETRYYASDISIMTLNTALMGTGQYNGQNRESARRAMLNWIESHTPDIVALQEVFVDEERVAMEERLRRLYPYSYYGPSDWGGDSPFDIDGGCLLLSRTPLSGSYQTVFREYGGWDAYSNKGVIHAQTTPISSPTPINLFVTHFQAGLGGGPFLAPYEWFSEDREAIQIRWRQLEHTDAAIQAIRDPRQPAVLMGDFNLDANQPEIQSRFKAIARGSHNIWELYGNAIRWPKGVTSDRARAFGDDEPIADAPSRHLEGSRIDHVIGYSGTSYAPRYGGADIISIMAGDRDASDHYGILTRITGFDEISVHLSTPPVANTIEFSVLEFRCIETTGGAGSDEVQFIGRMKWLENRQSISQETGWCELEEEVDRYDLVKIADPKSTASLWQGGYEHFPEWFEFEVEGREDDESLFTGHGYDSLGISRIRIAKSELQNYVGRSLERSLPPFRGDGGEYYVRIPIEVR